MPNRQPLVRMMMLVFFLIVILVLFSFNYSKNKVEVIVGNIFKDKVFLIKNNKAFSILLHTLKINGDNISGYYEKFDSSMIFLLKNQNQDILNQKLAKISINTSNCISCHLNY